MSLIKSPFFTIVIPAYNCQSFIIEAIESVEKQTFEDWELIVVEDHSKDNTYQIIRDYIVGKPKIQLAQTLENTGSPGGPRDLGVRLAKGNYVAFLDGDDQYYPQKLERHHQAIKGNLSIQFLHSSCDIVSEGGQFLYHQGQKWFLSLYHRLLPMRKVCILSNPFNISTTVIKKSLIEKYPFATPSNKLTTAVEDWFNWNKIMHDAVPVIYYDSTPLTKYRIVKDSISGRDVHRCEFQAINFFSILLSERKISIVEWYIGTFIRLLRIFFKNFLGYDKQ